MSTREDCEAPLPPVVTGLGLTPTWRSHTVASIVPISRRQLLTLEGRQSESGTDNWIRVHRPAMACRFEVVLPGGAARHLGAARKALDEVDRLEALLTVFRETSALVQVNRTAGDRPVAVGPEIFEIVAKSRALHATTDGAFDVTSTPLSRCWGFLKREGRLPTSDEIDAARARVGMEHVELDADRRTIHFRRPGIELNLGSIGKGYALDRMAMLLRGRGCSRVVLSAGGSSVLAWGGTGDGWIVDLRSRQVARDRLARIRMWEGALATSGAGEQFVDVAGKRYGHVLDPRTGWPASGVISASVVAHDAATADALSTAFLVGGEAFAERYCASNPGTLAVLTGDDGSARTSVFGAHRGVTVEDLCS
jgi:thiamine biosynthesis lipoprotein